MRRPVLVLGLVALAGCRRSPSLLPLEPGMEWVYTFRAPHFTYVESVRVGRRIPVGRAQGVELVGPMGPSRIGWDEGRLLASLLGPTGFDPPLPIGLSGEGTASWRGYATTAGVRQPAHGRLVQAPASLRLSARTFQTQRATLDVEVDGAAYQLITWFVPGIGIVRQEQRERDRLLLRMEWIRGPTSN